MDCRALASLRPFKAVVSAWVVGGGVLLAVGAAKAAPGGRDCFQEIERGRSREIVCSYPTSLSDKEREDLRRLTGDRLTDASCMVAIRIERSLVEAALAAADHVFEAPPQAVQCEIWTGDAMHPVTATFAPRVVFRDDQAVSATPGMANVQGVTGYASYLVWPVVQYVNRSPGIAGDMVRLINAYREHWRSRPSRVGKR